MTSITIIGAGKMGSAIAGLSARAGADIQILKHKASTSAAPDVLGAKYGVMGDELSGELVVLAVPYKAISSVLKLYGNRLSGKVVIDITNPINFTTFDELVVPSDSSAAAEIAAAFPDAAVVKAFNINFGETLSTGMNGTTRTTVIIAGDDVDAKVRVVNLVEAAGLRAVDVGPLSHARELEALGFLQITLAALAKTSWDTGFSLQP